VTLLSLRTHIDCEGAHVREKRKARCLISFLSRRGTGTRVGEKKRRGSRAFFP